MSNLKTTLKSIADWTIPINFQKLIYKIVLSNILSDANYSPLKSNAIGIQSCNTGIVLFSKGRPRIKGEIVQFVDNLDQ